MLEMHKVYLAGPISGQTIDGANDWREVAGKFLHRHGIMGLSPLRGKDFLRAYIPDGVYEGAYEIHPLTTAHGITNRDRWDTMRADIVFANFTESGDRVSIGTVMEIAWANAAGVYCVSVIPTGNVHAHPMVLQASSLVIPDFYEALHLIPTLLGI